MMIKAPSPFVQRFKGAALRLGIRRARVAQAKAQPDVAPQPLQPPPQGDHLSIDINGDLRASLLSACVAAAFKKSLACDTRLPSEVFAMSGPAGRHQRAILNALVGTVPHARYIEIGAQEPGTVCAAMYGNIAYVTCLPSGAGDRKPMFLAASAPYRSTFIDFNLVDGHIATTNGHTIARSNICFMTWGDPSADLHDLAPELFDEEFVLIADKWNIPNVRERVAAAIARAALTPVYDISVRTTQDDRSAAAAGPDSDWDQGCRIVVLRSTRVLSVAA